MFNLAAKRPIPFQGRTPPLLILARWSARHARWALEAHRTQGHLCAKQTAATPGCTSSGNDWWWWRTYISGDRARRRYFLALVHFVEEPGVLSRISCAESATAGEFCRLDRRAHSESMAHPSGAGDEGGVDLQGARSIPSMIPTLRSAPLLPPVEQALRRTSCRAGPRIGTTAACASRRDLTQRSTLYRAT